MDRARTPIVAGNWKMHHGGASGVGLAEEVARFAAKMTGVETIVAPPFTAIAAVAHAVEEVGRETGRPPIGVAAQNLYPEPKGAFTGEISAHMVLEAGANWVILGHSERRHVLGESDEFIAKKAVAALEAGLHPIICVGEKLDERLAGKTLDVVLGQLRAVLDTVARARGGAVIAYEPVWAIGTGRNATPEDAQAVHAAIRQELVRTEEQLWRTRILYGGSVKPDNARSLLGCPDVDGALVGGASLDVDAFGGILRAAHALVS